MIFLFFRPQIGPTVQKLVFFEDDIYNIDFEVTEVEKATCSDVNADRANVQHTYGQHSAER